MSVWHMTVGGDAVYFVNQPPLLAGREGAPNTLYRLPTSGGQPSIMFKFSTDRELTSLAVDARFVYWSVDASVKARTDGGVYAMPRAGGPVSTVAGNQAGAREVYPFGTSLGWLSWGSCATDPGPNTKGAGCVSGYREDGSVSLARLQ